MLSIVFILCIIGVWCAPNVLQDGDFEAGNPKTAWTCSCDLTLSPDSHTGSHSVKVDNRKFKYSGPAQVVPVQPGHRYTFSAYVKLLNQLPGHLYHGVNINVDIVTTQGNHHYDNMGKSPYIQLGTGWHLIGGDYLIPNNTKTFKVYIEIDQPQVNYLLDSAIFEEVPPLHNFRSAADDRIETLRKANVTIKLAGTDIDPAGLTVDLEQTYSEFIIASAIDAKMIVDPNYKKYQDFFYKNFEWGLPSNALKWTGTEHVEGHTNYSVPFAAVDALLQHGKKVKGHNIFWDVKKSVPKWQYNKPAAELKSLMATRIQGVVGGLKGKLQHWDVNNNENLHGDFYEQETQRPQHHPCGCSERHIKADPAVKLFLNDYNIVKQPYDIHSSVRDQAAKAGLPIMIHRELDVDTADEQEKAARIYEDLYCLTLQGGTIVY
ncbi:endo-1,4-beta-xylanase 3-like [Haliotis rubra]|uniref:endo-1,4-beta-xylanase 3-like n=1 Tax=Haliotis rubra TaxID=36100 RepID=UPI001EE5F317|nr:endo-1,4-beta-xylanase 3-like [Haliotis rubra]